MSLWFSQDYMSSHITPDIVSPRCFISCFGSHSYFSCTLISLVCPRTCFIVYALLDYLKNTVLQYVPCVLVVLPQQMPWYLEKSAVCASTTHMGLLFVLKFFSLPIVRLLPRKMWLRGDALHKEILCEYTTFTKVHIQIRHINTHTGSQSLPEQKKNLSDTES